MATVPFDTLALARKLEHAGFPPQQAQDTAAAFADAFGDELVTKSYLATELEATRTYVRNELEKQDLRLTIRLGTMLTVAIVLVATLVKLL